MARWHEITRDPEYQELSPEAKMEVKRGFFDRVIGIDPEFQSLSSEAQKATAEEFFNTPDDTGQGYFTSLLGSAGRGFGEMVPGAIEGAGALTGIEPLRKGGQAIREGLEYISPVNPLYAEDVIPKVANVGGQALSTLATAGAGGLAGKALGGTGAVMKGAQTAALGSAFLQGAAEGRREAEQYGMEGPQSYARTLLGGAIEAGTELLPFGMASETALAKRMLTGAPKATTFVGSLGSEAGEEFTGKVASNVATQTLAPIGTETPGMFEGALEAGAYGAVGGGVIGAINAFIPITPDKQTEEQKRAAAEFNATPTEKAPDLSEEENLKNAEQGGSPIVTPDGKVTWLPAMKQAISQPSTEKGKPSAVEELLIETMRNPGLEVANEIGSTSVQNLAATGNEASAAATQDFLDTANEIAAAEQPVPTGETIPEVVEELPPETEAKPIEPEENAPREITLEERFPEEPENGIEGRKAEEPSLGGRLRRPEEGEVKEEVDLKAGLPRQQPGEAPPAVAPTEAPLSRSKPREAIVFKKPIKTPLGEVLRYSWSSRLVEDVDRQGEPILRRISDWEQAATNAETGRDIVHRFQIRKPDGTITEVSLESTMGALSGDMKKTFKAVISAARRLPFMRAELAELEAKKAASENEYQNLQQQKPSIDSLTLEAPVSPSQVEAGKKQILLDGVFVGIANKNDLNEAGELKNPQKVLNENVWQWRNAKQKIKLSASEAERMDSLRRRIKKAESLIKSQDVESAPVEIAAPTEAPQPSPNLPALIAVRDNNATPEQVQSLVDQGLVEQVDGQNIITEAGVAAMPEDQRPKLTPTERAAEVEGMAMPVERDLTKAEQISKFLSDLRFYGTAKMGGDQYTIKQASDDSFYIEKTTGGQRSTVASGFSDIEGAQQGVAELVSPIPEETVATGQPTPAIEEALPERGASVETIASGGGMSIEEARQFLARRSDSGEPLIFGRPFSEISGMQQKERPRVFRTVDKLQAIKQIVGDINKFKIPVSQEAVDTYGITLPKGYVKQGELYVFQPQTTKAAAKADIEAGAPKLDPKNDYFTSNLASRAWRIAAGMQWDDNVGDWVHPDYPGRSRSVVEAEITESNPPKKAEVQRVFNELAKSYGREDLIKGEKIEERDSQDFIQVGRFVKVGYRVPVYEKGEVVGGKTNKVVGKITQIMPDGKVEVRLNQGGYKILPPGEIEDAPTHVGNKPLSPQTKAAAKTQTPESVRVDSGAAGGVQSELAEGSIPANKEVSPKTETTSSEKNDVVEGAMGELNNLISELPEKAQSKWTPEVMDKARLFYASRKEADLDGLTGVQKAKVHEALYRADKQAAEEQKRIDKAEEKKAKRLAKEEAESRKAEQDELKRQELNFKSLTSLISAERTNVEKGAVTMGDARVAIQQLNRSGDIPNVLFTWIGTAKDFLANQANKIAHPNVWAQVESNPNIEGMADRGSTFVFLDGVGVSDLDRKLAKLQGTTPEIAAVRRVILHENIHKGVYFLTPSEQMQLFGFLRRIYDNAELNKLAGLYEEFADWETNMVSYINLMEEALARDFDSMVEVPRDGIWREFMEFLKRIWQKITGKTSEPTLKDYKDVMRLIRNGLRNSTKAQADRTKSGGKVKLSYAGEKAIENLPEERRQFMRDSLDAANAMAAAGKDSEEIRAATGWFPGKYDGKMRWEVPDEGVVLNESPEITKLRKEAEKATAIFEEIKARSEGFSPAFNEAQVRMFNAQNKLRRTEREGDLTTVGERLVHPELFAAYPTVKNIRLVMESMQPNYGGYFDPIANKIAINSSHSKNAQLSSLLHEIQHWIQKQENFATGGDLSQFLYGDDFKLSSEDQKTVDDIDAQIAELRKEERDLGEFFRNLPDAMKGFGKNVKESRRLDAISYEIRSLNDKRYAIVKPARDRMAMDKYRRTAGEIEARDVQARQKLTPEQRAATAPYSSENIAPEDAIVLFGSGPQMSVTHTSPLTAVESAIQQDTTVLTLSPRQLESRFAVQKAYDAMPKENDVAVPLAELFGKTKEFIPDLTEAEFSKVIQDLYEDNAALLSGGKESIDPRDAEYLAAVKAGDMEKAQRMVDEAAKRAGYNVGPVFHRTKAEFTVFDLSKSSSGAVWGPAIYASLNDGSWNPASLKDSRVIKGYVGGKVIDLTQPSVLDLHLIGKLIGRDIDTIPLVTLERRYGSVAEGLKAAGFSAALHKGPGSTGSHIAVFEPNQIKSADPVTYDDSGNIIPLSQRFNTGPDIRGNVVNKDGDPASMVILLASHKASKIEDMGKAAEDFAKGVRKAGKGRVDTADYEGVPLKDFEHPQHNVKASEEYNAAAVKFVKDLEAKDNDIWDIADTVMADDFAVQAGLFDKKGISLETALIAKKRLIAFLMRETRLRADESRDKKEIARLEKTNQRLKAAWSTISTGAGQALQDNKEIISENEFLFDVDKAEYAMQKEAAETVEAKTGGTQQTSDDISNAGDRAADEVAEEAAEDMNEVLLREGEETLNEQQKSMFERFKDNLRKIAFLLRRKKGKVANAAKASLSSEDFNALEKLSDEDADALVEKLKKENEQILKALLGEESEANTPEKKVVRKKRKAMVDAAESQAKKGKRIKKSEGESDVEPESGEEQVSKAEKTAQSILKGLSERYSDPLILRDKKPNVDAMRELYRERVKQGVGKNQMKEESFVSKAIELGADEKTAGILWKAAELEIDAREAMRQDRILQRKATQGERADAEAHRIIYAKERLKRQAGFEGIDSHSKKDTIVKAFRDQVKKPVSLKDFIDRLRKLDVSEKVAERVFKAAEREKTQLEEMKAFESLEGPKALQKMISEISKALPGEQAPFSKQIPWRELLSQKASTVEEYRQRIFDSISTSDAFKNLDDAQKQRLADLFSEAWEKKRTEIIDRIIEQNANSLEAQKRKEAAKALRESRNKIIEAVNLGVFDNDELAKILGEKFGLKTQFTEEDKKRLKSMAEMLQDDDLNKAKRNRIAKDFLSLLSSATKIPVAELLSNWWVSSVLTGFNTVFSIGAAFSNGAYEILGLGVFRSVESLYKGLVELAQGNGEKGQQLLKDSLDQLHNTLVSIGKYLEAFPSSFKRAWHYLWSGDVALLEAGANDPFKNLGSLTDLARYRQVADMLAKDPQRVKRYIGVYLRFVGRLLTALDAFNVMVTKAGATSLAMRRSDLSTEQIAEVEKANDLETYKQRIVDREFGGVWPTSSKDRAVLNSMAEADMYRELAKLGVRMENADYLASQAAMTLDPTGFGGLIYHSIRSIDSKLRKKADDWLKSQQAVNDPDLADKINLLVSYAFHFAAYQAANVAGVRFARFAGNKFNQGLSFIPLLGLLRKYESSNKELKGKEDAFIDSIHRNQMIGFVVASIGALLIKAIEDEPDDEKRGWAINGDWGNLTPDQIKQKLSSGEKQYTIRIGKTVFNYQNWPINQMLSAIGSVSDLIRFSPEQWKKKNLADQLLTGTVSGLSATLDIPALTQMGEVFGKTIASKDPTEQSIGRFARVASGWAGGFAPRILKDLDYLAEPNQRKYKTLWEKTASHIPIYRRYVGEDYLDILGNPIQKNTIPGSREFMTKPTEPEYQILGALNSRGIWLTPANAEYRMIGKGRNKRRLTQEEADAYSEETGKGYKEMLLRYGDRVLAMPVERARAFLMDKADQVRDRALKRSQRR